MSETVEPAAAPPAALSPGPRLDPNTVLKYLAGGGVMGMLFTLALRGTMSAEAFETVAVGALGAIGGHAAGVFARRDPS